MIQPINNDSQTIATAYSIAGAGVDVKSAAGASIQSVVTVTTPSAGTFTAAASDICTKTAHAMLTGLKVQVSTTTTLPGGLSAATDYFVIKIDANTFYLATSLANAQAGTKIDITSAGTGTHTITPTAIAGASVKYQGSADGVNYADLGTSNNITATANFVFEKVDPMINYIRAYYTLTAGQLSVSQITTVKG